MRPHSPFRKLLIANRGEIALRVMRTARNLGYRTVAVYSTADVASRHVIEADQAIHVGDSPPALSYLNIPNLIAAAKNSGADAVHPGYGFLSENADFAAACREAGLVFVGPSPDAIRAMGNKAEAKRLMIKEGVKCIPGYQGEAQDELRLLQEAERIGFPVMIKATAGGGGRGIRLVMDRDHFAAALATARSEAMTAFGDATMILERAIIDPRHVEIQIFADRFGNTIHLGERDCSVQRRHQKLIEEAPSPAVTDELRARMGASAVAAARAIGYEGAGTVEYLLDASGEFYFMEMNTRLQVEHPVTEMTTGIDLVELQLRIAAGERLALRQEDIRIKGHSIEVRLCAEDARQSFMPQSGKMHRWEVPSTVRVEHALESGSEIPTHYDSMIAKLISVGATREDARRKLVTALEDLVALGVRTNQQFLTTCLNHPLFVAGEATTSFIDSFGADLLTDDAAARACVCAIAAVLLHTTSTASEDPTGASGLAPRWEIRSVLEVDGTSCAVTLTASAQNRTAYHVAVGDRKIDVSIVQVSGSRVRFVRDGVVETATTSRDGSDLLLHYLGTARRIRDVSLVAAQRDTVGDGKVRASMSGRVVAIHAAVGDTLKTGQAIFTVEAMKMEHTHVAPIAGQLTLLTAQLHQQVVASRIVAEIRADNDSTVHVDDRRREGT